MTNNFKEQKLRPDFAKKDISEVKKLINQSTSFSIVSMPGLGISMFLRYLATLSFVKIIHLDCNELSQPTKKTMFKLLEKQLGGKSDLMLDKLVRREKRVVIIFNRFDRLNKEFDYNFFANLRSLRDIDKEKIVMIFAISNPLTEKFPKAVSGGNLNMFSKTYFLKPFTTSDLDKLVNLNAPNLRKHPQYKSLLILSGGHYQLLQLLLKDDQQAVNLQLKELYEYLNFSQRKQLQRLAFGKSLNSLSLDTMLLDLGYISRQTSHDRKVFVSPLLEGYIKANSRLKLPVKESKLFKFLKSNLNKVVTKDEIFNTLWEDEEASDWTLNALIYRLRKNPTFKASGYLIESYKKIGYTLIKTR